MNEFGFATLARLNCYGHNDALFIITKYLMFIILNIQRNIFFCRFPRIVLINS